MSKKLTYEETDRLLIGDQLPDEDGAWTDMKRRLDENKRRRFFPLPPILKSCGLWLLTGMLLLAIGIWYWQYEQDKNMPAVSSSVMDQREKKSSSNDIAPGPMNPGVTINANVADSTSMYPLQETSPLSSRTKAGTTPAGNKNIVGKARNHSPLREDKELFPGRKVGNPVLFPETNQKDNSDNLLMNEKNELLPLTRDNKNVQVPYTKRQTGSLRASMLKWEMESINRELFKSSQSLKNLAVSAGIAGQQQVPLPGQSATPYNYLGRKGSIADYIPAFYLRLHVGDKWFLQTEFKYGAPQHTKEFVYNSKIIRDTLGVQTRASYRLKKTYYHQLPLGLHYQLKPGFSVGAGLVMNRFFGAISEQEIRQQVNPVSDTLVSKGIIRDRSDTLFRATHWQWFLETQYRYRRFSLGARYASGLQPYINYKNALGEPQQEKNHSLQLFLRFELWKSGNR